MKISAQQLDCLRSWTTKSDRKHALSFVLAEAWVNVFKNEDEMDEKRTEFVDLFIQLKGQHCVDLVKECESFPKRNKSLDQKNKITVATGIF